MPVYQTRLALNPKLPDIDASYEPAEISEVKDWISKTAAEQYVNPTATEQAEWFKSVVSAHNIDSMDEEQLQHFADKLKVAFEERRNTDLPKHIRAEYDNAAGWLDGLDPQYDAHEIIGIICKAELHAKNHNRLNPIPEEDARLFKEFRATIDKLTKDHTDTSSDHYKRPDAPISTSDRPSTEELLYWIEQSGLLASATSTFRDNSKPEDILKSLKRVFLGKKSEGIVRTPSNDSLVPSSLSGRKTTISFDEGILPTRKTSEEYRLELDGMYDRLIKYTLKSFPEAISKVEKEFAKCNAVLNDPTADPTKQIIAICSCYVAMRNVADEATQPREAAAVESVYTEPVNPPSKRQRIKKDLSDRERYLLRQPEGRRLGNILSKREMKLREKQEQQNRIAPVLFESPLSWISKITGNKRNKSTTGPNDSPRSTTDGNKRRKRW